MTVSAKHQNGQTAGPRKHPQGKTLGHPPAIMALIERGRIQREAHTSIEKANADVQAIRFRAFVEDDLSGEILPYVSWPQQVTENSVELDINVPGCSTIHVLYEFDYQAGSWGRVFRLEPGRPALCWCVGFLSEWYDDLADALYRAATLAEEHQGGPPHTERAWVEDGEGDSDPWLHASRPVREQMAARQEESHSQDASQAQTSEPSQPKVVSVTTTGEMAGPTAHLLQALDGYIAAQMSRHHRQAC